MMTTCKNTAGARWWLALALVLAVASGASAQTAAGGGQSEPKPSMTIYGFAMLDIGENFTPDQPQLVRHDARVEAAVVQGPVR